jgi:hypothetical protein
MSVFNIRGSLMRFMKALVKDHVENYTEGEDVFRGIKGWRGGGRNGF